MCILITTNYLIISNKVPQKQYCSKSTVTRGLNIFRGKFRVSLCCVRTVCLWGNRFQLVFWEDSKQGLCCVLFSWLCGSVAECLPWTNFHHVFFSKIKINLSLSQPVTMYMSVYNIQLLTVLEVNMDIYWPIKIHIDWGESRSQYVIFRVNKFHIDRQNRQ